MEVESGLNWKWSDESGVDGNGNGVDGREVDGSEVK